MSCAHNISAVQHEKRGCRVKCTLHTRQEATRTNGTTQTEGRTNEGPEDSIHDPRDRLHHLTAVDTAQFHMVFSMSFSPFFFDDEREMRSVSHVKSHAA